MRILVVCGAGASSTFVAQRLRTAARAAGIAIEANAIPLDALAARLSDADALLLGPHLPNADGVRTDALRQGVRAIMLPADAFSDIDGTRTLALLSPIP